MDNSNLAARMKEFYENVPKTNLMRRTPVVIRIDGKAFHSFTKGFKRPFDEVLIKTMQETTKYLCENIQGCVLGYTQSDEISLVLVDYQRFETSAWFDYEVQKMCSIAASMATMAFNKFFYENVFLYNGMASVDMSNKKYPYKEVYAKAVKKGAMFDARVFNIPKEEVTNYIYWRQLDASRNSIQMVGQANFSHNELHCKTCNNIQDMLMEQKGINWNDYPTVCKRGTAVIKKIIAREEKSFIDDMLEDSFDNVKNNIIEQTSKWIIDKDIPIFKGEGREYSNGGRIKSHYEKTFYLKN